MDKLNNFVIWILRIRKIGCQDLFRVKSLQAAHRRLYYSWLQREAPLVTHCLVTTEPGPALVMSSESSQATRITQAINKAIIW